MSIEPNLENTALPGHLDNLIEVCFGPNAEEFVASSEARPLLLPFSKRPKPSQLRDRLSALFSLQGADSLTPTAIRAVNLTWENFTEGSVAPNDFLRSPIGAAYRVTNVSGKGRGLIATRNITVGERVLIEHPVVVLVKDQMNALCFLTLPKQAIHALLLLHNNIPDNKEYTSHLDIPQHRLLDYLKGVATSNAFVATLDNGEEAGVILLAGSLFNHSQQANVYYSFETDKMVFTAIQPVNQGQELTVCYSGSAEELQSNYGIP
ncbi:putative set domain-containing protein [Mycena indigotica]|uniref:Putative set domain-containing protein n=1 Tax=Mycena indigotica TaxID=2126181 RepID=A0A8H6SSY5_9AGAR|nr:putative set domain-containing protein [Mycena indigotica]KAF7303807.1 putative set domain-containing protein [Mycena indigotica]